MTKKEDELFLHPDASWTGKDILEAIEASVLTYESGTLGAFLAEIVASA